MCNNTIFYVPFKMDVNDLLATHLDAFFGSESHHQSGSGLKEPVKYVLQGGKHIRPKISLDIYNTLTHVDTHVETHASEHAPHRLGICFLATEYIHSASLIIDDLPCMDNAQTRRGNKCIHLKYSEAIAQLTTGALLALCTHSLAFDLNKAVDSGVLCKDTVSKITMYALGVLGNSLFKVSDGQLQDLYAHSEAHSNADSEAHGDLGNVLKCISKDIDVKETIIKKTGTLFEMCFELGWIIGTGSTDGTARVRELANLFAMAFQIADDIEDYTVDLETNKKNVSQNYAIVCGKDTAIKDGHMYLDQFSEQLGNLGLSSPFFDQLVGQLRSKLG